MAPKRKRTPETTLDSCTVYTVGWIAALAHERAAARMMFDEVHNEPKDFVKNASDSNSYTWGRIEKHHVVLTSLPEGVYGIGSAAATANGMLASLPHIRIGLLVGIGAGIPGTGVYLGDVVVSKPDGTHGGVVQYDLFKSKLTDGIATKERKGFLQPPPRALLAALSAVRDQHETDDSQVAEFLEVFENNSKTKVTYAFPGVAHDHVRLEDSVERESPEIHFGAIISGNTLEKNPKDRDSILAWLRQENIQPMCFEMEAAGLMNTFPCVVIRGICDYADERKDDKWQRYAAATAAAFAKELLSYVDVAQIDSTPKIAQLLREAVHEIKQEVSTARSEAEVHEIKIELITQLREHVVDRASYNTNDADESFLCLEGTRVDLLERIDAWMDDSRGKRIFWLGGGAGTGKSAIARTVAHRYAQKSRLAACFFFRRGEIGCTSVDRFFPTIVHQLLDRFRSLRQPVREAIDRDSRLCVSRLSDQFEKLFAEPIKQIHTSELPTQQMVVVIDALDECDGEAHKALLVKLLGQAQFGNGDPIRIFVTSRLDADVKIGFGKLDPSSHEDVLLQVVQQPTIRPDLERYFKHRLEDIKSTYQLQILDDTLTEHWPGDEVISQLASLADPLFIFAFTACRYISETGPQSGLNIVLQQKSSNEMDFGPTYLPTLNRLVPDKATAKVREQILLQYRQIVGTIILLVEPLPRAALMKLTNIEPESMAVILSKLDPVLDIPREKDTPIRTFHLSFAEFLTGDSTDHPFRVIPAQQHWKITSMCLDLLSEPDVLRRDICCVAKPGIYKSSMDAESIKERIPGQVSYACVHLFHHLFQSDRMLIDYQKFLIFLQKHFLHWLEVVSWLGKAYVVITQITELLKSSSSSTLTTSAPRSECQAHPDCGLMEFLRDARHFVTKNIALINETPLQIYSSALMFSPQESIVRKCFSSCIVEDWISTPKMPLRWNSEMTLVNPVHVTSMSFSADSRILATSDGRFLELWDASTGKLKQSLERSHFSSSNASYENERIRFSRSGETLTWAFDISPDLSVVVLNTDTGETMHHWSLKYCKVLDISDDGRIAYLSDHTNQAPRVDCRAIHIADSTTGHIMTDIPVDGEVAYAAFSPTDPYIVATTAPWDTIWEQEEYRTDGSASENTNSWPESSSPSVQIWNSRTGRSIKKLTHQQLKNAASSTAYILGSEKERIYVWNMINDAVLHDSRAEDLGPYIRIASPQNDGGVRFRPTPDGVSFWEGFRAFPSHSNYTALSTRGLFASSHGPSLHCASAINLWNAQNTRLVQTLAIDDPGLFYLAFSPCGNFIAAVTDGLVRIWDIEHLQSQLEVLDTTEPPSGRSASIVAAPPSSYSKPFLWYDQTSIQQQSTLHDITRDWCNPHWAWCCGAIAFSSDGALVAMEHYYPPAAHARERHHDQCLRLYDASTCALICTFQQDPNGRTQGFTIRDRLVFSPDGSLLAEHAADLWLRLYDVKSAKFLRRFAMSNGPLALAFSANGLFYAMGSNPRSVEIRDLETDTIMTTLTSADDAESSIVGVAISPCSGLAAAIHRHRHHGEMPYYLQIWSLTNGTFVRKIASPCCKNPYMLSAGEADIAEGNIIFAFMADGTGLRVNQELYSIESGQLIDPAQNANERCCLTLSHGWLWRKGERYLWLPPKCNGRHWISNRNIFITSGGRLHLCYFQHK